MMQLSDFDLMKIQANTLFVQNFDGYITYDNEPWENRHRAPRLFVGWTAEGYVYRIRDDVEQRVIEQILDFLSSVHPGTDVTSPEQVRRFGAILSGAYGEQKVVCGPAYRFPHDLEASDDVVLITEVNSHLLHGGPPGWEEEVPYVQPCFGLIQDGKVVSVCATVRASSLAYEAGVDTLPEYRRRGFARKVVAAWANKVRETSVIPLYSTSWDNIASRGVAERLHLIQYGVDLSYS